MKKRLLSLFLVVLLAIPASSMAWDNLYSWTNLLKLEEEGVGFYLNKLENFTFVTPETLEENMELCLSRGGTEEGIRQRMNTGHVLWEGYLPEVPRGRFRLEVYEDEYTRSVWNLKDLLANQVRRVGEYLDAGYWIPERYHFFDSKKTNTEERQTIIGSFNAYPPYEYESGIYCLGFFNGKAYLLLYCQSVPASSGKLITLNADDNTLDLSKRCDYEDLYWMMNPGNDSIRRSQGLFKMIAKPETPVADLQRDYTRAIFNLNSGSYEYTGFTESSAKVYVAVGDGEEVKAEVDSETKMFTAKIQLLPGENEISLRATKNKLEENTITETLTVNDEMAMLVLTETLYGTVDRSSLRIAGVTAPGTKVTVQVDEEDPIEVEVKKSGKFSQKITASDFEMHTLTVIASQEGKEDCTVRTSFKPTYVDGNKRLAAYRKLLDKDIDWIDAFENPADYVGKKITMLISTTGQEYTDGMVIVEGVNIGGKSRPIDWERNRCYLVFESYLDDFLALSHDLTVYGEIIEPAHMEDGDYLRMQVEIASYYN